MGLSFRKRTKGKDSWVNLSASKKNGLGFSLSHRVSRGATINWKPGRGFRATLSIPGTGIRWVSGSGKSKTSRAKTNILGEHTSKAEERIADRSFAAREAHHDELVEMHDAIVEQIKQIDDECADAVNALYSYPGDITEEVRLNLVAKVDEFEMERADLVREDDEIGQRILDECSWYPPWKSKVLREIFADLRSKIIYVDAHIDWYREQNWSDDEILRLRVRRLGYINELKGFVEDNAIHALYERKQPSVLRIFAPMLSVITIASMYAIYIKYVCNTCLL